MLQTAFFPTPLKASAFSFIVININIAINEPGARPLELGAAKPEKVMQAFQ